MAIPDYQSLMLPTLKYSADGNEHTLDDTAKYIAKELKLTEEEQKELLPSGLQEVFANRVGWARTYLKKAGLLEASKRGHLKITEKGKSVIEAKPEFIDVKYLMQFDEFRLFRMRAKKNEEEKQVPGESDANPEEAFETAYENLRNELVSEILQNLHAVSPSLFEKVVVELLVKMGYGGSLKDAGKSIGKSGDEGIDGIIKEDRLGLDIIYIQAKRWEGIIGRPEIQKFAGALQGQRAKKGIFITTSGFTKEAIEYVSKIETKIILINGEQLAEYMIDFNVGVTITSVYELKKIDGDYFL